MIKREEVQLKLAELQQDNRLSGSPALVQINAPLALIQVSLEAKISALQWVLGKEENLIVG